MVINKTIRELKMPSFDIVSKIDMPSVQNGLDGVKKEISTRYDFKGRFEENGIVGEVIITYTGNDAAGEILLAAETN